MPYSEKICWTLEVSCIASFLFISFRWTKKQRILVSAFGLSCWEGIWLEYNRGGYKQQCTPLHTQPQLVFLQKIHFSITKCVHHSPLPWCSNRIKNSCALSRLEIFQGKVSFLVVHLIKYLSLQIIVAGMELEANGIFSVDDYLCTNIFNVKLEQ